MFDHTKYPLPCSISGLYGDNTEQSKQLVDDSRVNKKSLIALKECVRATSRDRAGIEDEPLDMATQGP